MAVQKTGATLAMLFILPCLFGSSVAQAQPEIVAKTAYKTDLYSVQGELYLDKEKNRADVWIDYEQQPHPNGEEKIAFKATSLATRMNEVEWRLRPAPITHVDGKTVLIYYGFNRKTGDYDGNRSIALLFHYPFSELDEKTSEMILKNFPKSVVRDSSGNPKYVKSILCRITQFQVYPIAAFDVELTLPKPKP